MAQNKNNKSKTNKNQPQKDNNIFFYNETSLQNNFFKNLKNQ